MARRQGYRYRAEQALGRPLRVGEIVHHHTQTQLVICDRSYHRRLHWAMKRRGIPSPHIDTKDRIPHRSTVQVSVTVWKALKLRSIIEGQPMHIVLDTALAEILKQWAIEQRAWSIAHGWPDHDGVSFPTDTDSLF